ncbi:hypothetical protein ABE10_00270, partial [Bacillus toyonensis]|nr:hypothetical protein [Bacillus toyonensis]
GDALVLGHRALDAKRAGGGDEAPLALDRMHDALLLEQAQRLADRGSGDAEELGELGLRVQPISGLEAQPGDQLLHLVVDPLDHALSPRRTHAAHLLGQDASFKTWTSSARMLSDSAGDDAPTIATKSRVGGLPRDRERGCRR